MAFRFVNVDLEIRARRKLDALAAAMGDRIMVLYCGPIGDRKYLLSVESEHLTHWGDPDQTLRRLCSVVEQIPPIERAIWDKAKKVFDIGYEIVGTSKPLKRTSGGFSLRSETLRRATDLGAELAVTMYVSGENEESTAFGLETDRRRRSNIARRKEFLE